ncbi:MAG: phosphodiester glycosidase family protein [Solobacterium sp.]|nr:phosphodiester glycosidase family protein [Solobacterium sp.]
MKKKMFYITDCLVLLCAMAMVLLNTFVFSASYTAVDAHEKAETEAQTAVNTNVQITDTSYSDENISIEIKEYEYLDTMIYAADVKISDLSYLYSVFAEDVYGKNVTEKTSEMAADAGALLAVNGDYYGARNSGYVIRNGTLYRESASDAQVLAVMSDGSFEIVSDSEVSAEELLQSGAIQVYSFGPGLIEDGEITVSLNDEVGKAKASNPRTAVCEIEPLHYLFVVSDGRTEESEGLSLYELASFLETLGVANAYNLDGGGSSAMVFMNEVINNPTTTGRKISERSVSDAICIGY